MPHPVQVLLVDANSCDEAANAIPRIPRSAGLRKSIRSPGTRKYVAKVEPELETLPPVICHAGDLNQVFLNLLINAAHAIGDVVKNTGEKSRIVIRSKAMEESVKISISDAEGGIPDSVRGKIFDPFFTTKEVGRGTGQGLTLAHAIVVEKRGGSLKFETETGRRTTFYLWLPVNGAREIHEAVTP